MTETLRSGTVTLVREIQCWPCRWPERRAMRCACWWTSSPAGRCAGSSLRQVLFGSNHPAWPAKACLEELGALELDAETEGLFLSANAKRVFSLRA
jgi:hypothetical protein